MDAIITGSITQFGRDDKHIGVGGGGGNADPQKPPEGGAPQGDPNAGGAEAAAAGAGSGADAGKTFTQADVDKLIGKTRAEEKRKFEDEAKKAAMTEAERLKAEKVAAETGAISTRCASER